MRRIAYGFVTVLGVLLLLFVLFFAVTDPDDIARKAVGEKAPPEVYAQWKMNHGYDKPLFFNRDFAGSDAPLTDTLLLDHFRRMLTFDFGRSDADDVPIARRLREGAGPSLASRCRCSCSACSLGIGARAVRGLLPRDLHRPRRLVLCVLAMSVSVLLYIIGGQYPVREAAHWFPISGFDPDPAVLARFLALPVADRRHVAASAATCASTAPSSSRRRAATTCARRAPRAAATAASWCATCCATR